MYKNGDKYEVEYIKDKLIKGFPNYIICEYNIKKKLILMQI